MALVDDDFEPEIEVGWMGLTEGGFPAFQLEPRELDHALPAIKINFWQSGITENLTLPAGTFGLSLEWISLDDAAIKEISALRRLEILTFLNNSGVTAKELSHLAALTHLRILSLQGTKISSAGLKELAALTGLEWLCLTNTRVSNKGLVELAPLERLKTLHLCHLNFSDAGYHELGRLHQLERLNLCGSNVTDERLKFLSGLTGLRELDVSRTNVTKPGMDYIRSQCSALRIADSV